MTFDAPCHPTRTLQKIEERRRQLQQQKQDIDEALTDLDRIEERSNLHRVILNNSNSNNTAIENKTPNNQRAKK